MLIGITGKARSGKDTAANYLLEAYAPLARYAFSDPLKKAAKIIFDLSEEQCKDENKEKVIDYWGLSPRRMYQLLGTECCREVFFKDIWIRRAELELLRIKSSKEYSGLVITDVRFDNEASWVRANGGRVLRIVRNASFEVGEHLSESGVSEEFVDYVIHNDDTISQLHKELDEFMLRLFL